MASALLGTVLASGFDELSHRRFDSGGLLALSALCITPWMKVVLFHTMPQGVRRHQAAAAMYRAALCHEHVLQTL